MKEENDANHRYLETQISAASKDRTKLRVELENHTTKHIAGARSALQEGYQSYTKVKNSVDALNEKVNSTINVMNSRTSLEVKPLEARLQTSIDAQQKLLKQQTDSSLANMETRLGDITTIHEQLHLLKKHNDDSLTYLNGITDKHEDKLETLNSMILDTTERLQIEIDKSSWQEYQNIQEEQERGMYQQA